MKKNITKKIIIDADLCSKWLGAFDRLKKENKTNKIDEILPALIGGLAAELYDIEFDMKKKLGRLGHLLFDLEKLLLVCTDPEFKKNKKPNRETFGDNFNFFRKLIHEYINEE